MFAPRYFPPGFANTQVQQPELPQIPAPIVVSDNVVPMGTFQAVNLNVQVIPVQILPIVNLN